jgi:hypothetical protein
VMGSPCVDFDEALVVGDDFERGAEGGVAEPGAEGGGEGDLHASGAELGEGEEEAIDFVALEMEFGHEVLDFLDGSRGAEVLDEGIFGAFDIEFEEIHVRREVGGEIDRGDLEGA